MPNLKFTRLTILSNSTKSANQFEFHERLNLVTAQDNSVGKSTLVKLIFWTLGCEPAFDVNWSSLDAKAIVDFQIEEVKYKVLRERNLMIFKEGDNLPERYSKITGDYSRRIALLMNFDVLLPNKETSSLEIPPPAYFFLPFYIDQKKGWNKPWDSFENLEQYSNWKSVITKFHIGMLSREHFVQQIEISKSTAEKTELDFQVGRIDTALEIIGPYLTNTNAVLSNDKLDKIRQELEVELSQLAKKQEDTFDKIFKYENDVAFLGQQFMLSEKVVKELEADYTFAVENLPQDNIVCPFCGVAQDNSIVSRASLLVDKKKAQALLDDIEASYTVAVRRLSNAKLSLREIQAQLGAINEKYAVDDSAIKIEIDNIAQAIGSKSIAAGISADKSVLVGQLHGVKKEIRELKAIQKALTPKETIDEISQQFMFLLVSYLKVLNAGGVNLSDVNSPLDYSKIFKAGGAAEGTRAVLAYFLAIYSLINNYGSEVVGPLVIDTPNQHEQSIGNYDSIVTLLMESVNKNSQIILCAMDNEQLSGFKAQANVITLSNQKLMDTHKYETLLGEFELA